MIYPNPTDGYVYIGQAPQDLIYKLTDLQGRLIAQGSYNDKGIRIIEQGVYFITLHTDDSSWTEKVIRY